MEIYNAQLQAGRPQTTAQNVKTVPVQNASPEVALTAGRLLAGQVTQTTPQLLSVALVGGGEIQLPANANVAQGESVVIRVVTTAPQVEVTLARTHQGTQLRAADLGLTSGQTAAARVVGQLGGQQAVVDVNGQQITLAVPGAVEAGSLLPVRIDEEGGRVFLTVLAGQTGVEVLAQHYLRELERPRDALGKLLRSIFANLSSSPDEPEGTREQTEQLKSLLERFQSGGQASTEALKRGLEDGGLLLESKLAKLVQQPDGLAVESDLKALLLQLRQAVEADGKDSPLLKLVRQALSQIEQLQLTNILNQLHDSAHLWQLPGWFGASPVYVRIEPDDQSQQSDDPSGRAWQVLMAVDLDDVGSVRVDARLQSKTLRVILYVAEQHVSGLEAGLDELRETLSEDDFDRILLAVHSLDNISEATALKINRTIDAVPDHGGSLDVSG